MLKDVLIEINKSSSFSKSTISKNLNIPEGMIDDLIKQLTRMGYLIEILGSANCDTPCNSCPYTRNCNSNPIKMFSISEKGKDLLKNIEKN